MAKKRGHGEGSIFQRGDGKWTATITVGRSETGKRIRRTVYGNTKAEVTNKLTRLQNQKLDGTLSGTNRMTVADLLDRWLEDSSRINTAPNTHARYAGIVRLHLKPMIGGTRLSNLTPMQVQSMLSKAEREGCGERTRSFIFATLRRALNVGLRWGLVARNVCDAVDPPKYKRGDVQALEDAQIFALLKLTSGTRWHALFTLALTTGLRQGELFGLHWSDVDLEKGLLYVRYSLEEIAGNLRLKEPKSKTARRVVTLPATAIDALWDHKTLMLAEGLGGQPLVFTDTEGAFLRKSNFLRRVWKNYRTAAKLPDSFKFHDLRHTSATILLGAGIHPKIVQERLGHASIQLTMDTYSHCLPSLQQDAATKFEHLRIAKIG